MTRIQRQIEEHRLGDACLQVRDCAGRPWPGVPVWAEQETHAFVFGCVAPDLAGLPEPGRQRCAARLGEVFNKLAAPGEMPEMGVLRVDVPEKVHLGRFLAHLDQLSAGGQALEVHVSGHAVGLDGADERAAAERVAEVYTLCFAHPAVQAVFWDGLWDGEAGVEGGGLLRLDFAPKHAFRYLDKLIGTAWHTRASGATDGQGLFRFRGFFGDYRVAARVGEEPASTTLFAHRPGVGTPPFVLTIPASP